MYVLLLMLNIIFFVCRFKILEFDRLLQWGSFSLCICVIYERDYKSDFKNFFWYSFYIYGIKFYLMIENNIQ